MRKLISFPLWLQLLIMVSIMAVFSLGIIVYSGLRLANEKIDETRKDVAMLADIVANEQNDIVADMQQLMTALIELPEVRSMNVKSADLVLRHVLNISSKYSNIFIADRTGNVIVSAIPTQPLNVADTIYFKKALSTGHFSAGDFTVSRFNNRPVLPFAHPIRDWHGNIAGIIIMGIDLSRYKVTLDALQLPSGSSYLLIDGKGIIMKRGLNPSDFFGESYDPVGFQKMVDGPEKSTFIATAHDGIKRFIAYRKMRLKGEDSPYMYIRAGIPAELALKSTKQVLTRNLILLSVSLLLVVLLVLFIGKRWITNRIGLLENASQHLADGNSRIKISELIGGGELGRLGMAFDNMIEKISVRETELRQSELRYRTLFDDSPDGIVIVDEHGTIVEFNDATCRQLGYTREEFSTLSISDLDPDENQDDIRRRTERSIQEGTDQFDVRHKTKQGEIRHTHIITKSIVLSGKPYIYAIWQDITERKLMEETLRRSEENLQKIMDSSPAVIFVKDLNGNYIFINTLYEKLFHVSKKDIVGKTDYDIFPQAYADALRDADRRALDANTPIEVEEQIPQDDGLHHYLSLKFPLLDINKQPYALCGIATDITERSKIEERESQVQKIEAIGILAGGIAHDFNNLLQGVFGYISLAKLKKDDQAKSLAALEEAERALHMSVKLTNQLLTFSKGGKPVKKRIDLLPVVENAAKFALSGSRTDFRFAADDGLWQVDADEGQISQVIQNIVLNADQAMPQGGRVEIAAANVAAQDKDLPSGLQKGEYVKVTIKDTGVGIPEQYIARIFDPYFTTKEKGSGLGLATSYSIIKNHNGSIEVASAMGKGTTFFIYLPAIVAKKTEAPFSQTIATTAGRTGRVLVMDDEQVVRDVAGELIKALGHRVEFASHGKEAIEKYQEADRSSDPFDVVILDLTIKGGMGGKETLQMLTKINPDVKAVVSSGYSDDAGSSVSLDHGLRAILKKPYDVSKLQEVLNTLLNS